MADPVIEADRFAAAFRHAEYALKQSGLVKKRKNPAEKVRAEADWEAFAKMLGPDFFNKTVQNGWAKTLVGDPPRVLMDDLEWTPKETVPLGNIQQLIVNGVCRVRNNYFHGDKFTGGPEGQWERDLTLIREAHFVLKEALSALLGSA